MENCNKEENLPPLKNFNNLSWTNELFDAMVEFKITAKRPRQFQWKKWLRFKKYAPYIELKDHKELWVKERQIIKSTEKDNVLDKLYADGNFFTNSRDRFYEVVKERFIGISRRYVMEYLKNNPEYQKYVTSEKRTTNNSTMAKKPLIQWRVEIVDEGEITLMILMDVFSRMVWTVVFGKMTEDNILSALESVLDGVVPNTPKTIKSARLSRFAEIVDTTANTDHFYERYQIKLLLSRSDKVNAFNQMVSSFSKVFFKAVRTAGDEPTVNQISTPISDTTKLYNERKNAFTLMVPLELHECKDESVLRRINRKLQLLPK